MNLTERPMDEDTLAAIEQFAEEAAHWLELENVDAVSPEPIVAAIDELVYELQKAIMAEEAALEGAESALPDAEDASLTLASLWGQQLVRQFGWQWATVVFHELDNTEAVGVFSPDRSLAIYPFHFVFSCLEDRAPVTILLAFHVLQASDRVPELPAYSYENVMDNVHHTAPRD